MVWVILCLSIKGFVVRNCRFLHTFEKNNLATVKNKLVVPRLWPSVYIYIYIKQTEHNITYIITNRTRSTKLNFRLLKRRNKLSPNLGTSNYGTDIIKVIPCYQITRAYRSSNTNHFKKSLRIPHK